MHPGNPKAILIVQNLLKNSMKINNYTLYFFTIINIIIIIYSLIFLFYTKKKKTCILDSSFIYTIFLNLNISCILLLTCI